MGEIESGVGCRAKGSNNFSLLVALVGHYLFTIAVPYICALSRGGRRAIVLRARTITRGKAEKMDVPGENGIEEEVTEEIIAAMTLQALNPSRLPTLLLQLCSLSLEGSSADGFLKTCAPADVDVGQQRFLIPAADARDHILPYLHPLEDAREGIPIRVYLKDGTYYRLLFKQKEPRRCIITHRGPPEITRWRHVCNAIRLQPGDPIKLWSLRHTRTQELCFFVAKQVI